LTRRAKVWLFTLLGLALFAIAAWFLGTLLRLKTPDLWVLRGGLWSLGAIAAVAIGWFLSHKGPVSKPASPAGAEVDAAMATARARLRSARLPGRGALDSLPVVLLVGPEGSAKTSSVIRSTLETELLAGDVFRGDAVTPTRLFNLWYTRQGLILEAGGRLVADSARWQRLLQHLLARRIRSAFWGGPPPARAVVVCIGCEDLLKSGEAVTAMAQALRARLGELTAALGVRLPAYVFFTKADALPHFTDYVRNFSRDEVREVLGTTFALEQMPPDSSAEQVFTLVDGSLQRLFRSLAANRLKYLPRESASEVAGSAYEFPREFRKVAAHATQCLVELSRPNQLELSPYLRGFYFTGARPILVTDSALEAAQPVAAGRPVSAVGATTVFHAGQLEAQQVGGPRMTAVGVTSRRVPQWVFLDRLLPEVVLGDRVALGGTRTSRRVDRVRRLVAVLVIAAALVTVGGLVISYRNNRDLQADVQAAERGLAEIPSGTTGVPPLPALRRLDAAAAQLQRLSAYQRNGPPWRLRWGLFSGNVLYPGLRSGYFAALERALVAPARDSLAVTLRRLPDTPGQSADYGQSYSVLKAYLITTTNPTRSTPGFVAPILLERWLGGGRLDPTRADLVRRQFAFYAGELADGSAPQVPADDEAVADGRAFLRKFAVAEAVYRTMLAETSARIPSVQFEREFPAAAGVVRDPYVVPGAFTKQGWDLMQSNLAHAERFFSGEDWVTGVRSAAAPDRAGILAQLRSMYVKDYIDHWRAFLKSASVTQFADVGSGVRVIGALSSNQSPLLALLSLVSRHTAVDTVAIAPAFQPAQVVTPPGDTTKYIGPGNEAYINALVGLQTSLQQVASNSDDGGAAAGQALNDATQAQLATRQLANKFRLDQEGGLHTAVQRLLETPILSAQTSLQAVGPARLNAQGRAFCAPFQRVLTQFPFNPTATSEARLDEVTALFQPGSGALWSFVDGQLGGYVARQGTLFAAKPGTAVAVSPAFLAFLNRAAQFATALYRSDGSGPALAMTLRPILSDEIPGLTLNVDGQTARFTRSSAAAKRVAWLGSEAQFASLSGEIGGRDREILSFPGTWGLFRLFSLADWSAGEGSYTVKWRLPVVGPGGTALQAVFDVTMPGSQPVLQRNFFGGVNCTGRITR
jgi:type VI secretion system protein ImpL